MIGATLGPYQILAKLGEGGMRAVYKARDSRLDRFVALKLLPADLASDPERLSRFEREAQAASALNHPAIVTIYDVGTTDRQPWISMELVEGKTLREVLDAGSVPLRRALSFAAQIADGLAKAHEAGIIHRDLKPENVMVSADGFAKILDFGLARLTLRRAERETSIETRMRDTEPGRVMGTLAYMSPEQASGAVVDFRSDQFSFGAVFYEMLAGTRAFERSSSTDTLAAILRDNPRPVAELNAAVPPPVRWVIERSLEKEPADRYGSTRDLARDLARARDHLSELSTTTRTLNAPPGERSSGRAWGLIGWAVAAISLMATVALLTRSPAVTPSTGGPVVRFALPAPEGTAILAFGLESSPVAVSPDGRYIVAVATTAEGRGASGCARWTGSLGAN